MTRSSPESAQGSSPPSAPSTGARSSERRGLHGHRVGAPNMIRAGIAEAVGTFFLIFTGTATAAAATLGKSTGGTPPNSLAIALAFGLVLTALVGALGQVSGAHLNGAVTLGLAVTGKFPWSYVPAYLGFQLLGALAGAGATWVSFGNDARNVAHLGATTPSKGVGDARVFIVEALITFLLVFVIIAVATDDRVPAAVAAPAIGFALVAAVLIGGGVTGGAVNPDRALGPAIMSTTFTSPVGLCPGDHRRWGRRRAPTQIRGRLRHRPHHEFRRGPRWRQCWGPQPGHRRRHLSHRRRTRPTGGGSPTQGRS